MIAERRSRATRRRRRAGRARPSGSRGSRARGGVRRRGDRSRPAGARGDADDEPIADAQSSIADAARATRDARPCITSSFQAEDVVARCTCCARCSRTSRCSSSTRFITSRRRYAYRDELAARWKLNLVNLRAAEPAPGLWQTSTDALLRAAQGRAALLGARRLRRLVHGAAARAVAVAREPRRKSSRSGCRAAR